MSITPILRSVLPWLLLLAVGLFGTTMQAASAQTTPNALGTAAANNSGATSPGRPTGNPAGNPSGKPPGKPDASSPFGYTPDISQVFGLTASEFQARFDSQTVPAAVLAGSNFTATVRYTNTGNLTWSGATNFKLGSQNPQDNLTWGIGRIPVAGSVGLNGSTSFTINATAPTTPGKYAFQWRMLQEAVAWFGDYTPTVLIDVIAPSNGASFVSQVPPLTVLTSGTAFSIPITFKNTGTTTWSNAANYRLGSQGPQDNTLWLGSGNRVLLPKTVPPGESVTFVVSGTTPQVTSAQTLNFQWAMVQDGVAWFGDISPAMAVRVQPVPPPPPPPVISPECLASTPKSGIYTGKIDSSLAYGNNNNGYFVGSPMSLIVVHAGLLADRASGYITVTPIGNVIQFLGGSANGIVTLSDSLGGCAMKLSLGAPPPVTPTISASHSPNPLLTGQPYSANWASSNAASINYLCRNNAGLVASGSSGNASGGITGTAATGWVNDPPTCTFTATSAPNASGATATASASDRLLTNLPPPPPPPPPTISVTRNPQIMSVGENYTLSWSSSNATSVKRVCTTDNSFYGFVDNSNLPLSGSTTGQPDPRWVQSRSTCTWTATSASGATATVSETMITQPAMASTRTVTYVHTDTLGSPVAKTNANGDVISRTRYEPYGAVNQGATPTIGFTGHVNDADTGLTYMQQRYYDPLAGRFLSVDPVLTDGKTGSGFNRFAYAENNPYKYVDPDGRKSECSLGLNCEIIRYDNGNSNGPLPDLGSQKGPGSGAAGALAGAVVGGGAGYKAGLSIAGTCDLASGGACLPLNPLIIGGGTLIGAIGGGIVGYLSTASGSGDSNSASSSSSGRNNTTPTDGRDLKKLSPGEIRKLEAAGYDAHTLKGSSSKFDMYKDKAGNVYQLLKGGRGEPSSLDINIKTISGQ